MPGLVPGIHVLRAARQGVDGRDKPGHDADRLRYVFAGEAHACTFPRQILPEPCRRSSPNGGQRAQGRPGAGGTRWSVRYRNADGVDRWGGRSPGLPCVDGFNGVLRALPGSDALLPPVAVQALCGERAWGRTAASSSLRAKRSNPESFRGGILDCFAALAMTAWRQRALSLHLVSRTQADRACLVGAPARPPTCPSRSGQIIRREIRERAEFVGLQ
jgi:hypothetical protein